MTQKTEDIQTEIESFMVMLSEIIASQIKRGVYKDYFINNETFTEVESSLPVKDKRPSTSKT